MIRGRILPKNKDLPRKRYGGEQLYPPPKVPTPRPFVMRQRAGLEGSQIPARKKVHGNLSVRFILQGYQGRRNIRQKRKGTRSVTNRNCRQILQSMDEGKW